MQARAGSSKDGTLPEGVRIDTNRFEPIGQGEEAEAVARQAADKKEAQVQHYWTEERRIAYLSKGKNQGEVERRKMRMVQERSMEVSRAQGYPEQWSKTTASSSESPGQGSSGGSAAGRKRAGVARSVHEARSPEPSRDSGPPISLEASRGDDLGGRGGSPGRLVCAATREEESPGRSPGIRPAGTGPGPPSRSRSGSGGRDRQAGQLCPATTRAFLGAGDPGKATGRGGDQAD
jgi:hypothetical protein